MRKGKNGIPVLRHIKLPFFRAVGSAEVLAWTKIVSSVRPVVMFYWCYNLACLNVAEIKRSNFSGKCLIIGFHFGRREPAFASLVYPIPLTLSP